MLSIIHAHSATQVLPSQPAVLARANLESPCRRSLCPTQRDSAQRSREKVSGESEFAEGLLIAASCLADDGA